MLPLDPWGFELAKFPRLRTLRFRITYIFFRDNLLEVLRTLKSSPCHSALRSLHIHCNVLHSPKIQTRLVKEKVAAVCREIEHVLLTSPYVDTVTTTFSLGDIKSISVFGAVKTLQVAFPNLHQRGLLDVAFNTGDVSF